MRSGYGYAMIDWLFPKKCVRCCAEGNDICGNCLENLKYKTFQQCPYCRKSSTNGIKCPDCEQESYSLDQLLVVFDFYKEKAIKLLLHRFKYKFSVEISEFLVDCLMLFKESIGKVDIVCAVPIHQKRKKFRGFNQSEILAAKFATKSGIPYYKLLLKTSESPPQARLHKAERLLAVLDTFSPTTECPIKVMNKKVVLIDDVATTCSTLSECAKILKNNGAKRVIGLVLARG